MISDEEVARIADGWIEAFSVDPYVVRERDMEAWFKLDHLIHDHPEDALRVFEKMAQMELINWTFEGISIGPLQTFLMLHGDRFNNQLEAMKRRNRAFNEMHAMAVEGL